MLAPKVFDLQSLYEQYLLEEFVLFSCKYSWADVSVSVFQTFCSNNKFPTFDLFNQKLIRKNEESDQKNLESAGNKGREKVHRQHP